MNQRITWIDPLSKQTLTYATIPMSASDQAKLAALDSCRESVRAQHGDDAALSVQLEVKTKGEGRKTRGRNYSIKNGKTVDTYTGDEIEL